MTQHPSHDETHAHFALEGLPDAFLSLDAAGRVVYANGRACALTARTRTELMGLSLWDALPDVLGTALGEAVRGALRERSGVVGDVFVEGRAAWWSVHVTPHPAGFGVTVRDVTREKRAQVRQEHLQAVTAELAAVSTPQEVVEIILGHGREAVGAFGGAVYELEPDGQCLRQIGRQGYTTPVQAEWLRFPVNSDFPTADVVRTGVALFLQQEEYVRRYGSPVRAVRTRGVAVLPLIVRGRVLGSMGLSFDVDLDFDAEERAFITALGGLCAQALERARAYAAEQAARVQAEQANALLDALVEHASVGIAFLDPDLRYRRVNAALADVNDLPVEAHIGQHVTDVLPDHPEALAALERVARTGGPTLMWETRNSTRLGRRHYLVTRYPVRTRGGELLGFGTILVDMTDFKRAQEDLARHANLLEQTHDAILTWDLSGSITYWNHGAQALYGYAPEDALGQNAHDLLQSRPEGTGGVARLLQRLQSRGEWTGRVEHRTRDGRRISVESRLVLRRDAGGNGVVLETNREVTRQLAAERALRESEQRFRSLVMATAQIVWTTSPAGAFDGPQQDWSAFTGQTESELLGTGWLNAVHPDDRVKTTRAWQRALTRRGVYEVEHRLRRFDGEYRVMQVRAVPVLEDDGRVREWVGTHMDVTELQRAARERDQREREVTAILESVTDAFFALDREWRFTYVNREAERVLGRARDSLLGRSIWAEFDLADDSVFAREYRRAVASREAVAFEAYDVPRAAWFAARAYPTADGGLSVYFQNVNARRAAESALRDREARYRALFEGLPYLACVLGADGAVQEVNGRWREYTGVGEPSGHDWAQLIHPEDMPGFRAARDAALQAGEPYGMEVRLRDRRGSYCWHYVTAQPFRVGEAEEGVAGWVGIASDIDARLQAELMLRAWTQELEQQVRRRTAQLEAANEELEAFSYSVSHDLRTPLRHIMSFAGLLRRRLSEQLDGPAGHYLQTVEASAGRMDVLISELLEFSRLSREPVVLRDVDLDLVVRDVRAELQLDLGGRDVEWRVAPLPVVRADPTLIKLVLSNLLGNAVKYTSKVPVAVIEVGSDVTDDEVTVWVRDNGAGFDAQYASRLFKVFQRLHRREDFEGTGVGLANVQRIIARHGGRVGAEGQPGAGATFSFTLPRR